MSVEAGADPGEAATSVGEARYEHGAFSPSAPWRPAAPAPAPTLSIIGGPADSRLEINGVPVAWLEYWLSNRRRT